MNYPNKPDDEPSRPSRRFRRILLSSATVVILVAAFGVLWVAQPWKSTHETSPTEMATESSDGPTQGISASGTTVMGTVLQKLPAELSSLGLTVESVAATVDSKVQAGDPLLTITADSLDSARQSLQTAVHLAQNTYDQAAVDYKTVLIQAHDELASNQLLNKIAEEDHTLAVFDLQSAVDKTRKAMDEAHQIIADYPSGIAELKAKLESMQDALDTMKLNADSLKKAADQAQAADQSAQVDLAKATGIMEFLADHGISSTSEMALDAGKMLSAATASATELRSQASAAAAAATTATAGYNNLKSEINHRQTRIDKLESELASAQSNLAATELAYYKANLALVKGKISIDETYQAKLIDYRNAQSNYDLTLQKSQASFDAAKLALETAKATLATFEDTVGSGSLLAKGAFTVSAIGFTAGDQLTSATPYVTLTASDRVSIPLTVDQTQISRVAVGDPAQITIGQAQYEGTVSSIQPTSSSTSMSNVYYTVTVEIKGDLSGLASDLSADVILNPDSVVS